MEYRLILVALSAAVGSAACATSRNEPAASAAAAIDVQTARIELVDLAARFEAGGVVRARLTTSISSRVLAPITDVRVNAGDRIRRGDVLVVLDGRELVANRARAAATLVAAQQAVTAADADQRSADAALVLARSTHSRIDSLHARRSATTQELDEATASLTAAEARLAGAQARLAGARAGLDAAQAATDAATVGASYATLAAPFDGIVSERLADPGTMAAPGVPLLTVEDTSAYRLEVRVDEARVSAIHVGTAATVTIDTLRAEGNLTGRVAEIARLDAASHSFLVKVEMPAANGLRSGLYGTARFDGPSRRTIAVPASAVLPRGQLTFVFVVEDGAARLRPVSAGMANGDRVEVLAGLRTGEQVVVAPPPALTDGSRIRAGATR